MKYPSLNLIGHTYGNEQVVEWLKIQFFDLNNFVGVKEKMSDKQLKDVANLFYCDCYNLNISEVALFFLNYKLGKFGEFYGIVDPLKIMTAKNKFLAERITALNRNRERMQQERENEQRDNREQIKNAILAHNAEKRKKALNTKKKWLRMDLIR
jgi:sRNA-binding protein